MLDPRLLRSFVVLAEELHFGRAAERLHMAQPALSQQLRRLEQQVGTPLMDRSSRAVALTDSGRAMLEPARLAVRAADQAERAVKEATDGGPSLQVGVDVYLDDVIPSLAEYDSEHADASIWISRMSDHQGQQMLAEGLLDAFVGFTPPGSPGRQSRMKAVDIPIMVMVGPAHALATETSVSLARLRESTIAIAGRAQTPERFDYWVDMLSEGAGRRALDLREIGPPGPIGQAALGELVDAGDVAAFGPPATLSRLADTTRILPFDPPVSVPSYISWNPAVSPRVDAFVTAYTAMHTTSADLYVTAADPQAPQTDL